jgi:NADH dehydrogenase [ubiquinone] 1 alpha subcomplex assembly factor 7
MSFVASYIKDLIKFNGPITVARFMKTVLTHKEFGYYNTKEVFGGKGDFITSPEISQVFGECLGLKIVQWAKTHRLNTPMHIVELGPGRGTLIHDVLRTLRSFPDVQLKSVTLIEVSDKLRHQQKKQLEEFPCAIDWLSSIDDFKIHRCKDVSLVVLAHEFFDALPIHAFTRIEGSNWREIMVGLDHSDGFVFQTAPSETLSQKVFFPKDPKVLKNAVEVCPEAIKVAVWMKRCFKVSPKALGMIFDYGQFGPPTGSLRAIKGHNILDNPLSDVGDCDLSADVDFRALYDVFNEDFDVEFKYQGQFLQEMGIRERTKMLVYHNRNDCNIRSHLVSAFERLVDPQQMGSIYKVLSILSSRE